MPVTTLVTVSDFDGEVATLTHIFTGETEKRPCRNLVITGLRLPRDELFQELLTRQDILRDAGVKTIERIGDALSPGAIAHAVHSGHLYAREMGQAARGFRRDAPIVEFEPSFTSRAGLTVV